MDKTIRVLIVDSNQILAKQFGSKLTDHLKDVEINYAKNPIILKDRLNSNNYDVIFADVYSMNDPYFTQKLLDKVHSTVIIWSTLDCMKCPLYSPNTKCSHDNCPSKFSKNRKILPKPIKPQETSIMLESISKEIRAIAI